MIWRMSEVLFMCLNVLSLCKSLKVLKLSERFTFLNIIVGDVNIWTYVKHLKVLNACNDSISVFALNGSDIFTLYIKYFKPWPHLKVYMCFKRLGYLNWLYNHCSKFNSIASFKRLECVFWIFNSCNIFNLE